MSEKKQLEMPVCPECGCESINIVGRKYDVYGEYEDYGVSAEDLLVRACCWDCEFDEWVREDTCEILA